MGVCDIIVAVVIGLTVIAVIGVMIYKKVKGKGGCCSDCGSCCGGCSACNKGKKKDIDKI